MSKYWARTMSNLAGFLLALIIIIAITLAARRALIIFELDVRDGKLSRARGRIPQALLNDLLVVCPHGHDSKLTIACRVEQGRPRLIAKGNLDAEALQRMRNLLGLWPLARLKAAPKIGA
jgi:hypothetical protein